MATYKDWDQAGRAGVSALEVTQHGPNTRKNLKAPENKETKNPVALGSISCASRTLSPSRSVGCGLDI